MSRESLRALRTLTTIILIDDISDIRNFFTGEINTKKVCMAGQPIMKLPPCTHFYHYIFFRYSLQASIVPCILS